MSDTDSQAEPTMEEILASIRKIISEDDEDEGKAPAAAPAKPEPEAIIEPEPEPEPEVEPEPEEEVLELTELVEEEVDFEAEPEAEPEPEVAFDSGAPNIDDVDPSIESEILMSEESSEFAMGQFGVLSDLLTTGYQGAENTLEDLVREMLKPMLRVWLDKNLPPIVERMVAKEIARLARTKKP